jgi:inosose dehydratase
MPAFFSGRRAFLEQTAGLALASCAPGAWAGSVPEPLPNPVGYATISWPDSKIEHALETISNLGFKGVQMLGFVREVYRGARADELRDKLKSLKLQPVTLSCSDVDLKPDDSRDETGQIRSYALFFQRLGGKYLQVTDGGDPRRSYSAETIRELGARMNTMGKLAQDSGLTLGYHPHFGTIGETREGLARVLEATDPRYVKLIVDVGHLTLGGADPPEIVRTYHERLIFLHFKDVRQDAMELAAKGRDSVRRGKYTFCEIGTGAVSFPAIIQALHDTQFAGWVIVELDGYQRGPGGADSSARANKEAVQKLGFSL